MTRKEAFQRVQLWLGIAGLLDKNPDAGTAHNLCNLIWNLTEEKEAYSTLFVLEVWETLKT